MSPVSSAPVLLRTIEPKALRDGERLAFIRKELIECIGKHAITQAAMEGYAYGAGAGAFFELGEVGGLVKCLLAELRIPLIVVAPAALKKFVTHSAGADKAAVMESIQRKWGVAITQNDMADAYGLARVASVFSSGISIYRPELEVVHSLKQPRTTSLKPGRTRKGTSL